MNRRHLSGGILSYFWHSHREWTVGDRRPVQTITRGENQNIRLRIVTTKQITKPCYNPRYKLYSDGEELGWNLEIVMKWLVVIVSVFQETLFPFLFNSSRSEIDN